MIYTHTLIALVKNLKKIIKKAVTYWTSHDIFGITSENSTELLKTETNYRNICQEIYKESLIGQSVYRMYSALMEYHV